MEEIPVPPELKLPAPAFTPADLPNRPLKAAEAARVALRYHFSVKVAEEQIKAVEGQTQQTRAALIPQLAIGATYTDIVVPASTAALVGTSSPNGVAASNPSTISSSSLDSTQLTANLRALVFDFQHTYDSMLALEEQQNAAAANLTRVESDQVYAVKQAFYQCAQNLRLVEVNQANLEDQRQHLTQAVSRFKGGVGLPSDVTRAQAAVADAVGNLTQARADAASARVNLALQMGLDPRTPLEVDEEEEPEVPLEDLQGLYNQALEQRPEMASALATIRALGHSLDSASTVSAPSVTANLSYLSRHVDGTENFINSLSFVIGISFNVWDGGLQAGAIKTAEANLSAARYQLEGTARTVVSDVTQALVNVTTAQQRLKTAELEEANAAETLRLTTGRYKLGLGIILDVLDAQSQLLSAQTNRVNASTQLSLARSALRHAMGAPLPGQLGPVVPPSLKVSGLTTLKRPSPAVTRPETP